MVRLVRGRLDSFGRGCYIGCRVCQCLVELEFERVEKRAHGRRNVVQSTQERLHF